MRAEHTHDRATPEIRYRHEIRTYRRSGPHPANAAPASPHSAATSTIDRQRADNSRLSEMLRLPRASGEALSNRASRDESASAGPPRATPSAPLYRASRG